MLQGTSLSRHGCVLSICNRKSTKMVFVSSSPTSSTFLPILLFLQLEIMLPHSKYKKKFCFHFQCKNIFCEMKSNYFIKALSYLKQSRSLLRTQVSSNDCYFNLKGFLRYDLLQIMFALSMDDSSSSSSL